MFLQHLFYDKKCVSMAQQTFSDCGPRPSAFIWVVLDMNMCENHCAKHLPPSLSVCLSIPMDLQHGWYFYYECLKVCQAAVRPTGAWLNPTAERTHRRATPDARPGKDPTDWIRPV